MPNTNYKVVNSSSELNTVYKYVSSLDSPAIGYVNNLNGFLAVVGEDGLTNGQRIIQSFKTAYERNILINDGVIDESDNVLTPEVLPIKPGTVFYIEYEKVNTISFLTEGLEVVSTDEPAFKAAQLARLEADKGYVSVNKINSNSISDGTSKDIYPNCTVWIWCRALSSKRDELRDLQGEFFDLTPFIQKLTTNMGKNGGNFQINLPPLVCELDADNKWIIRQESFIQFGEESKAGTKEYVSEDSLYEVVNEKLERNQFLFNNIISSNDLIFIRFEALEVEKNQRYKDAQNLYIDKSKIPNRIYDMIGLVDSVTNTISTQNNDVSIRIAGRDLSKLFIEDGTYFYALENSQGILRVAGSTSLKNTLLSRFAEEKGMQFIGLYNFTSIEKILKYIINQLANIKIVPSELFTGYNDGVSDRRNKRFNEINFDSKQKENSDYKPQFKEEISNGIWQIIKLVIDKSVSQRRLADTSFSTAQGSLLNFIHTAVQEPLCQFYMDTYGDQYHLIVRKPPFDQKSIISLIDGSVSTEEGVPDTPPAIVDIEAEDVLQEVLIMDDSQVYSWYHFFPKGALINTSIDYSSYILPAIFFDEYAQVFGSKPFQQSHAYVPYVPMSFDQQFGNLLYEQAYSDLKYVIESNQYLPFTRKGTIAINGDRRIKIGNLVRYKPTGEIFYVEGVQQDLNINENNIDRTTTLQVSRGMVEQLIYGIHLAPEESGSAERKFVSYFNLIDTRLNQQIKEIDTEITVMEKVGVKQIRKPIYSLNNNTNVPIQDVQIIDKSKVKGVAYLERYNEYPENKKVFIEFINRINASGYSVILLPMATNRTYIEQAELKRQNSANAAAGHSRHEVGRAIDITIVNLRTGKYYSKQTSESEWRSTGVPAIANSLGLQWGGKENNGTFGKYIDRVHFEMQGSPVTTEKFETITVDDIREVKRIVKTKGVDQNEVFKNFKVNKFTFNFFLKNLQFNPEFREVRSKQVYNSDQEGSDLYGGKIDKDGVKSLQEINIVGKRKKKR